MNSFIKSDLNIFLVFSNYIGVPCIDIFVFLLIYFSIELSKFISSITLIFTSLNLGDGSLASIYYLIYSLRGTQV